MTQCPTMTQTKLLLQVRCSVMLPEGTTGEDLIRLIAEGPSIPSKGFSYGDMLTNAGFQHGQPQHLPPPLQSGSNIETLPLHLPVLSPHQSGYIILPKSTFVLPKNNGPPLPSASNRKPDRKPPNAPPPGKNRPPNNRQRRPQQPNKKMNQAFNNVPFQQSASQQLKHVLPNGQFPPRNNFNNQFLDATIPQNVKPDQSGQNRPPILPNFQQHPPLGINVNVNPNDFLLNSLPPRKIKIKNRPKNVPVLVPTLDLGKDHIGESSHEFKLNTQNLPQIGKGDLELGQILSSPHRENEVPDHSHSQSSESHLPPVLENPHGNQGEPSFTEKSANPGHYAETQSHAEALKQNEPEKNFHIPFPDFAEPEPSPQLQPSNFPTNLNVNNRIISPQESKQNQIVVKPKNSDVFDQINEESAPISLYGQVLPPNDATYSSEINNFPGLHDGSDEERWPVIMPEMPKITHLDVKCEKNLMRVSIDFDKPFHGIIYSKGHYSYGRCVHLPAGSGHNSVEFDISINSCGMQGNSPSGHYGPTETGSYFENTVVVQYDPLVQEVWDQARKLRCNWHDQYEKTVTFRPFNVDMLQVVRADFAGDNVGCWMQIQVGKGPWANEVSGIVRIGQTMTLVLAIKDEENKFDMMVRNCIAHDGNRAPIELVDSSGCVTRPKLMSRFTKVKNFGSSASVLSFAHFQAFKFPDSTEVHIQCTVQICRQQCEDQCSIHRRKRQAGKGEVREIGLNSVLQVVAAEDLTFSPFKNVTDDTKIITEKSRVCMSSSGFAASLILLLSIVIISCLIAAFLFLKQRNTAKMPPLPYDMAIFKKHMEKQAKKQQQQQQQVRQQKKM
ncbi:ZP domain-containing protein [Trichonephila inaurata madagascariensis]|uniref:ZP domain-containing protein n=1 Tax=Trichonephila inaurata madagascariensis TaxID=2747483 RepID=A0A8X6XWG1_9ARAC|nr:ZP domain-containing protein [Trichonephila inaurata madagascariensis]